MRDHTRKVMKDRVDHLNGEIYWTAQIDQTQQQLASAKTKRDELKAERDLVKADLDAEPETEPQKKEAP